MTFGVPFTFHNTTCLDTTGSIRTEHFSVVESALLSSKPTALASWTGRGGTSDDNGLIIGCEDGTVYVFQGALAESSSIIVEVPARKSRRKPQQLPAKRSRASSLPPSTNPLSPTLAVPPRASVVLGVSTEQVQAPRNYVDFDDEPGRLKDILNGKNPRERDRVVSDTASLVTISPAPSTTADPPTRIKQGAGSIKSCLSVSESLRTGPQSPATSAPTSPRSSSRLAHLLNLRCHIIPEGAGHGNSVQSLTMLEDKSLVIVLHHTGHLGIYSSMDGSCIATAFVPDFCGSRPSRDVWTWVSLHCATIDETQVLFATAATDSNTSAATPDAEENSTEKSMTVAMHLSVTSNVMQIQKLAKWELDGPAKGIGVYKEATRPSVLFSIDSQGHFIIRTIGVDIPESPTIPASSSSETDPLVSLHIPRSIKAMVARSSDSVPSPASQHVLPKIVTYETVDIGNLISDSTLTGLTTRHVDGNLYGIAWAHREMIIFEYHSNTLRILLQTTICELEDVEWVDNDTYALSYRDRIDVYRLQCTNGEIDHVHDGLADHEGWQYSPVLIRQIPTGGHDASIFSPSTELLLTNIDAEGRRQVVSYRVSLPEASSASRPETSTVLWQSGLGRQDLQGAVIQTSSIPLDLEVIVQGFSDGRIRQYSLEQMTFKYSQSTISASTAMKQSEPAVSGSIIGLYTTQNLRTKERYILGGADDGSILVWTMGTFELCARWTVFSTPLVRIVEFQDQAGHLSGCVLCISQQGTIAVIAVDGFQFLYMIPGSPIPLTRILLGESSLVLIYGESMARLWDLRSKEMWRSMAVDKAEELFREGGWTALDISEGASSITSQWQAVAPAYSGTDAAATLAFSLDTFVAHCVSLTKTISTSRGEIQSILQALERLRYLLSIVLTPGLNDDVDSICVGKLKTHTSTVCLGLSSPSTTTLYPSLRPHDVWCISGKVSASRMLAIVFILRAMSLFEELSEAANTVISFYTFSLPSCVGVNFCAPSLEWLGHQWFSAPTELRAAIRSVFDATLAHVSDQEVMELAEKWQQDVPFLQPIANRESETAALALLICGCIATEKFNLLSVSALTDTSKSLAMYLHDENSSYRTIAIELCSKGFHVWQHYIDTMEILRALFSLATGAKKDAITLQNIGAQARVAVLNIATQHTPLFMSTLCLDVLNPPTLEHRRSVMQIIAFLIRKRRFILQPNLPRLMEAVVKSLDPNSNANREAVLDTATEIIGFVVKNFPSVDFHMSTQRLAVGTNEGPVVMYDLKTATRLYVLEGQKRSLTACSFSPDGRRLVTLSLAEQSALVWKVGSSFSSFFYPGAPPSQGHGGSEPFKTLNFHIGAEANMTMEEALDLVAFEWVADRSVKVKIRDSILTFST